jgi:hypothetical protein
METALTQAHSAKRRAARRERQRQDRRQCGDVGPEHVAGPPPPGFLQLIANLGIATKEQIREGAPVEAALPERRPRVTAERRVLTWRRDSRQRNSIAGDCPPRAQEVGLSRRFAPRRAKASVEPVRALPILLSGSAPGALAPRRRDHLRRYDRKSSGSLPALSVRKSTKRMALLAKQGPSLGGNAPRGATQT